MDCRLEAQGVSRCRWLLLGLLACLVIPPEVAAQNEVRRLSRPDYFYAFGKRVEVNVSLTSVGVLLQDGMAAPELDRALVETGLRVGATYPGVAVLEYHAVATSDELVKVARNLEAQRAKQIMQAGLVVTPATSEVPMLVTDRLIVKLSKPDSKAIARIAKSVGAQVVMENPFERGQYLLRLRPTAKLDALRVSNQLQELGEVEYAQPDFVKPTFNRQFIPNDTLFNLQWHLNNTGQSGGLPGADTRAAFAWQVQQGAAATIVAAIDSGFDATHPDFRLWVNPGEVAGNGLDDGDANTFVDDVNGWDFTGCDIAMPPANCGDANVAGDTHGTEVAGSATAIGNNMRGVSGSCPGCSVMLIRRAATDFAQGLMFGYAQAQGAQIMTNSWGFAIGTPCTTVLCGAINTAATLGRGGLGSVVLFAMNNPNVNDCTGAAPDISSLPSVIAVSRSSNFDVFDFSGFGNCMDLLATSAGVNTVPSGRGTLWITTTDPVGAAGNNNATTPGSCPTIPEAGPPPADRRDYTSCFNGTSAATPITAGIAGLVLSANAALTRTQVQNLLQDTADKIQDSTGAYALANGFSAPATGQATHGWGRVNADEAVRVVAPVAAGGRAGVDIFLRDNRLDWGNMQRPSNLLFENPRGFIGHWRSVDIKVDSPVDGLQPAPTAATFDAFVDEKPSAVAGDVNRVYVRVRNRGPTTATLVNVKLHWAQFGAGLPALPADFWTAFPGNSTDTTRWHPTDCAVAPPPGIAATVCQVNNLAYSGASTAATLADAAQIVQFSMPAPGIDPTLDNHFCLFAVVDSTQDPVSTTSRASTVVDDITPNDNNATHRNYADLVSTRSDRFERAFFIRNPYRRNIRTQYSIDLPRGWTFAAKPIKPGDILVLKPDEERRIDVRLTLPSVGATGEVELVQWNLDEGKRPMGGLTFGVHPDVAAATPRPDPQAYLIGMFDLRKGATTEISIMNPGARDVRAVAALFDMDGNALGCVKGKVDSNGAWDVLLSKHLPKDSHGVVKVVGLDPERNLPAGPIVGNQRAVRVLGQLGETGLHPVTERVLLADWPKISSACGIP